MLFLPAAGAFENRKKKRKRKRKRKRERKTGVERERESFCRVGYSYYCC